MVKNQLGTFSQPEAIFLEQNFLNALPKKHLMAGYAEMLKHGLIADAGHWEALLATDPENIARHPGLIHDSVRIKMEIVDKDPHEQNERAILNFGHTLGHALESWSKSSSGKELTHGHAIALGMIAASRLSVDYCGLDPNDHQFIIRALRSRFKPLPARKSDINRILELARADKKSSAGELRFVLLERPGSAQFGIKVPEEAVLESIHECLLIR
jgi:3-dehydroquinate synthase